MNFYPNRFYVRRTEVWGGSYHYCVAERGTWNHVSRYWKLRGPAEALADQMNRDLDKYLAAKRGATEMLNVPANSGYAVPGMRGYVDLLEKKLGHPSLFD